MPGQRGILSLFSLPFSKHGKRRRHRHQVHAAACETLSSIDPTEDEPIQIAEDIILSWSSDVDASLFAGEAGHEASRFLSAAADIHRSMTFSSSRSTTSTAVLLRSHSLLSAAMHRLEREFRLLLTLHGHLLNPLTQAEISASEAAVSDLQAVADAMISAGYGRECFRVYKAARKSFVNGSIQRLGCDWLTQSQIHKLDWAELESRTETWLVITPVAFRAHLSGERLLCDRVFAGSSAAIRESCFSDVTRDTAARLLAFPEWVARSKRSPERLFRILELYETITDLIPEIESMFTFDSAATVRTQAAASLLRLAEAARSMLANFEEKIHKDASRSPPTGGAVHPLTHYVIDYLTVLPKYELALADIFASSHATRGANEYIPARIAWLVVVLICKLDVKAEMYRKVALSYLFLANNLQYIVRAVRDSGLRRLLGDAWLAPHEAKARHYAASYVRLGWSKVAAAVPAEAAEEEARERLREFNAVLEVTCREQEGWVVVAEGGLLKEVRAAVEEMVLPAYRVFYDRYRSVEGMKAEVVFSPEDVRNQVYGIIDGPRGSGSSKHCKCKWSSDSNGSE